MRSSVLVSCFVVLFITIGCNRTNKNAADSEKSGAEITFKEQTYDFGQLDEGDIVEHDFEFTNTGAVPIEIIDVEVQCGCTVASRPQGLIGVGRSDKVTVRFNSTGKPGVNKKFVNIIANTDEPLEPIAFTANVVPASTNKENR